MRASPVMLFITTFIIAIVSHLLFCIKISHYLPLGLMQTLAIALLLLSLLINTLVYREFKNNSTPHAPFSRPKKLLTNGVFRYSRNPIYLALVISFAALAFIIDTAWLILFSFVLLLLINSLIIPDEEKTLTNEFNGEYEKYKKYQRRWL